MAPYGGPNLAALVALLRDGLRDSVTLGHGLPRAPIHFRDGGFELHALSGGSGFGVQADMVEPFVDEGLVVRVATWQALMAWLCEHWDRASWGEPLREDESLRLRFDGDRRAVGIALHRELGIGLADALKQAQAGVVAATLEVAAAACRAARAAGAAVDFDVVRAKKRRG